MEETVSVSPYRISDEIKPESGDDRHINESSSGLFFPLFFGRVRREDATPMAV